MVSTFYRVEDSRRRSWMDGRRDGQRDGYLYIIDCLRQGVAFALQVIKCAVGAIKGNKMRRSAIMNERRNGRREGPEGGGAGFALL